MAVGDVTPESDDALLRLFDADPDRAVEECKEVFHRLVKLFEWNGCRWPEDLAQETLMRGVKRVSEGATISTTVTGYLFGIAFKVLQEERRDRRRAPVAIDDVPEPPAPFEGPAVEARICLDQFLSRLPTTDRDLIIRYYTDDHDTLMRELGLSQNALRVRAHRLRVKLMAFVRDGLLRTRPEATATK